MYMYIVCKIYFNSSQVLAEEKANTEVQQVKEPANFMSPSTALNPPR